MHQVLMQAKEDGDRKVEQLQRASKEVRAPGSVEGEGPNMDSESYDVQKRGTEHLRSSALQTSPPSENLLLTLRELFGASNSFALGGQGACAFTARCRMRW